MKLGSILAEAKSVVQAGIAYVTMHTAEAKSQWRAGLLSAVQKDWHRYLDVSQATKSDHEIALAAIRQDEAVMEHVPAELKGDRAFALAVIGKNWRAFQGLPKELQNDVEFVKEAMTVNWRIVERLPALLKHDHALALEAIQKDWNAFNHLPETLKTDPEFVLAAVQQDWHIFNELRMPLKGNREIVLAAVRQEGRMLATATDELKNDREIVMAAVQQTGRAIQFVSGELRKDREIIMTAARTDGFKALVCASAALQDDRELVLFAMKQNPQALQYASGRLRGDRELALIGLENNPSLFVHLSDSLRNDPVVAHIVIEQNGMALKHASDRLQNNYETVAMAVRQNWRAFEYASEDLRKNEILAQFVEQEKERQSSPNSQALNFLWLNLDLPPKPDSADGSIRMPMPEEYIKNVREAAIRHPRADVHLWVDKRRLTPKQYAYLEAVVEAEVPNVRLKDLCTIPEYINEELYSRTETKKEWRNSYGGVVWLQVDAAKILISLQGDYDQKFFADLDHAHVNIESAGVQMMIRDHGLMIGGADAGMNTYIENQLWGFDRSRQGFFERYYAEGLRSSYQGTIAYAVLDPHISEELHFFEKLSTRQFCLPIGSIGLEHAVHPGHEWETSKTDKGRESVPGSELQAIFKERSTRQAAIPANSKPGPSAQAALKGKV